MWQPQIPQVVFVHLPKTGGMSLHTTIAQALGPEMVLRVGDAAGHAAFLEMGPDELAGYAFISGHFTLTEALERTRTGARFVTLLRDPVARLLSAFNYMATWSQHPLHEQFRDRGFAEFVADAGEHLSGEACRQLTGASTAVEAIPLLESCYAVVATTPRVADMSQIVTGWFGLHPPSEARENVTPGQGRVTLDSATCETLLEVTREDRALFDHVALRYGGLMLAPGIAL